MKTRMQPIGMVWNKLPRVVRDLAMSLGKQIRLEMDGEDTELDKTIIEAIKDPLTHIVRNSCDHGIETPEVRVRAGKPAQGKLTLRAYHEGGRSTSRSATMARGSTSAKLKQKAIEKGLMRAEQVEQMSDRDALNLVFLAGLLHGAEGYQHFRPRRGHGRREDQHREDRRNRGSGQQARQGTTVKIKIPLTLAIIPGLVVTSGGERFVIPQVSLLELVRLEGEAARKQIQHIHGTPVYRRRGLAAAGLHERAARSRVRRAGNQGT